MANNQSQSQNSSSTKSQSTGAANSANAANSTNSTSKPQAHSSGGQSASTTSAPTESKSTTSATESKSDFYGSSANSGSGSGDMIEQAIAKGVTRLIETLEPQLNRIGTQIVSRAMSRGQNFADNGVKRMQDQPWYMVGGALALVAVGVGLLFAFENSSSSPESPSNIQ